MLCVCRFHIYIYLHRLSKSQPEQSITIMFVVRSLLAGIVFFQEPAWNMFVLLRVWYWLPYSYMHHLSKSQCEGYGFIMLYTCGPISVSIGRRQEWWWKFVVGFLSVSRPLSASVTVFSAVCTVGHPHFEKGLCPSPDFFFFEIVSVKQVYQASSSWETIPPKHHMAQALTVHAFRVTQKEICFTGDFSFSGYILVQFCFGC